MKNNQTSSKLIFLLEYSLIVKSTTFLEVFYRLQVFLGLKKSILKFFFSTIFFIFKLSVDTCIFLNILHFLI